MSNKYGAPAIQRDRLACPHSLLNDEHNSTSVAQNKAVQRQQQLCLAFQLSAYASLICKQQMSHKSGALAIQHDRLVCLHSPLNDVHVTASAA